MSVDVMTPPVTRAAPSHRVIGALGLLIIAAAAMLPIVLPLARRSVLPAALLLSLALPLIGMRVIKQGFSAAAEIFRSAKAIWTGAAVLLIALPFLAGSYLQIWDYLSSIALAAFGFLIALGLAARCEVDSTRLVAFLSRYRVRALALLFVLLSVLAGIFVLDNVPHVSDEVAYQFQARALASGHLSVQPPPDFDFFDFVHTIRDSEKWYGIMNPGWPAILAVGYAVRTPWLVNPILGGVTLLVLFSFFRRAGYSASEARIAVLLLAVSPLLLFMSSTYMAHSSNLLLFAVFLWVWIRFTETEQLRYAALAGAAVAFNLLVRPIDTGAACAPFLLYSGVRALRRPKLFSGLIVLGVIASLGVAVTWVYNKQLTGDWRVMPMTKYFTDLNPHEKFGLGFGPDMGTKVHGPEWPGYYPKDAVRVSSYRLEEFLRDFNALPMLLLAAFAYGARRRNWNGSTQPAHLLLLASALTLFGVYIFHFYHGIAYGSRHYYLALPTVAMLLARPLAHWLEAGGTAARRARLVFAALIVFTLTLPYGRLIAEYGRNYRGSSGDLRAAVNKQRLSNAIVFIDKGGLWGWKSAFPLNTYPLDNASVIYAKDRGPENRILMDRFPDRSFYVAYVRGKGVEIAPLEPGGPAGG